MEFGRQKVNTPKKAMKLAWKNHKGSGPLTASELKKAWKQVKGKGKGKGMGNDQDQGEGNGKSEAQGGG